MISIKKVMASMVIAVMVPLSVSSCSGDDDTAQSGGIQAAQYSEVVNIDDLEVSVFDGTSVLMSGEESPTGRLQMVVKSKIDKDDPDRKTNLSDLNVTVFSKSGETDNVRLEDATIGQGDAYVYYLDNRIKITDVEKVEVLVDGRGYDFSK